MMMVCGTTSVTAPDLPDKLSSRRPKHRYGMPKQSSRRSVCEAAPVLKLGMLKPVLFGRSLPRFLKKPSNSQKKCSDIPKKPSDSRKKPSKFSEEAFQIFGRSLPICGKTASQTHVWKVFILKTCNIIQHTQSS